MVFLRDWWKTLGKNQVQKMMIQITPVAICWELWKTRCSCRYGNQTRFYIRRIEQQILWNTKAAMDKAYPMHKMDLPWNRLCEVVENMVPKTIIKSVIWSKPMHERIKFNTDGSYLGNNGKAGIGGIARNCEGKFIFAFVVPVIARDHNAAEEMLPNTLWNGCLTMDIGRGLLKWTPRSW
ncbi:hypothetical protein P3S68_029734 [Capsicum galapagoense]